VISYTFAPGGSRELIPAEKRKPAVEFVLKDADGQTVNLSDYKDKVVLLNFWATWCGPCKIEIPWFVEFEQTYKDKGFAVLGVASDVEGWAVVRPFMNSRKVNYRVVLDDDKLPSPYKDIQAIPATYLIDRQGRVAAVHNGLMSKDTYEDGIRQLLAVQSDPVEVERDAR
jgi:cytochrome c biogenesis protein CcmG/thiol:disulfide interchange protein DsbE